MKYPVVLSLLGLVAAVPALAQAPTTKPAPPYRPSATKINDLVHTKLDVRFDYAKRYLYGQEWVTLKPHAYPTDSLRLDAKGMDIKAVAMMSGSQRTALKYTYSDAANLRISLGRTFKPGEEYTIYLDYTAKPDELKVEGSAAITDAKGLYFINPDSAVAGKPVQIWTQGETEGSSAWFPTIDRPNQKTTEEISMTVPAKYVTLSNGRLVSSTPAGPGLRTDVWKMELPHAPYLFMMAVGDFKIYKDTWRGKEVSYYLEPNYAPFAKQIFGNTPRHAGVLLQPLGRRVSVEQVRPDCVPRLRERGDGKHHRHPARRASATDRPRIAGPPVCGRIGDCARAVSPMVWRLRDSRKLGQHHGERDDGRLFGRALRRAQVRPRRRRCSLLHLPAPLPGQPARCRQEPRAFPLHPAGSSVRPGELPEGRPPSWTCCAPTWATTCSSPACRNT